MSLTDFRSYEQATCEAGPEPVVFLGENGAGKTNILEALSFLAPGRGLREASLSDIARRDGDGRWAVAASLETPDGTVEIGTGLAVAPAGGLVPDERAASRIVRIDGANCGSSAALAQHLTLIWLTPAMDGLFTGPPAERRRFLDRLAVAGHPAHRTHMNRFERAMQNRNRLLVDGVRDPTRFAGLEVIMAEEGVTLAAARRETVAALMATMAGRRETAPGSPFPWAEVAVAGTLEGYLADAPAIEVEDRYVTQLSQSRERDRAAGRTLDGPHRSDLLIRHGPKDMPAALASTGEQKALLVGLVLAHAVLVTERYGGRTPILLLDEIAAHLDDRRRAALFTDTLSLGAQIWMTGTDRGAFAALEGQARFVRVAEGRLTLLSEPFG